jgi:hypothetical protein
MMKPAVRRRPSVWFCAALSLLLLLSASRVVDAAAPVPFEDVNDNGVFDGNDKDISAVFQTTEFIYYRTPHSIVIPAGVPLTSPEKWAGFFLDAGKSITVNSNMTSAAYAGLVDLRAMGGRLTIAPGVVINGRDYVSFQARGDVVLGAGSSVVSRGVSANLGTVHVRSEAGDVMVGAGVKFNTLRDVFMTAVTGDITVGLGLRVAAPQGALYADTVAGGITLNGAQLRVAGLILQARGPVEFQNNRLTIPRLGLFLIRTKSTLLMTGTLVPKGVIPTIEGAPVIN